MSRSRATSEDGTAYRDLNGNGRMDPYEDPRLPVEQRVADLVPRLSLEEKAGLLFHTVLGVSDDLGTPAGIAHSSAEALVSGLRINHFNLHALPSPAETVRWHNRVQELAEATPHGIPVTFSSDPRHAFAENSGASFSASDVSQWPEPIGLAAIGDAELVRAHADTVRRDYLALGIRSALHPQIDLATEARWARQAQTFGANAALAGELVVAYLEGLQGGADLGPTSVAAMTKHFPGGGAQEDGSDPHFPYGRYQAYPGGRFEDHLAPFRAAIAAGTSALMPYYGLPRGLRLGGEPVEEVAFSFNRRIVTGLLREELGYDGVVCTDWGLVTDAVVLGKPFPARAWGVDGLSELERAERILDAGCDQFGGEERVDLVLELVRSGRIAESRIDESVRRLLAVKFRLGLFDDPYLPEDGGPVAVGLPADREAGHRAQAESVTILKADAALPLPPGRALYVEGLAPETAAAYGTVVADPADADLAIVRLQAPFEPRDDYFLEAMFHQGSLDLPVEVVERIRALARRVPVVLDVLLDRPAVLTPVEPVVAVLTATYGASDGALLDALAGAIAPRGRLPFELPRSMAAVEAAAPDVPGTADPLFPRGFGLTVSLPAGPVA